MGRELKRVPLDFDHPIGEIWPGFLLSPCSAAHENCEKCFNWAEIMGWKALKPKCPEWPFTEPPKGDGYQLWETTTEGSPASPVFATLDELCEWCETNATTFGPCTATKEQWKAMLEDNFVHHTEGNITFI